MALRRRLAIIDADTILYAVALSAEMCAKGQGMDGEDMWFQVRNLEDCYQETIERLDAKVREVDGTQGMICLSDSRCFRYDILPTYKANRARTRRPPMMAHLRAEIIDRKPFELIRAVPTLEADDLCGIASTALQKGTAFEPIIVSDDKDLLGIPGLIHHRGDSFEVTLEEADRHHLYQALIGDSCDGYKGLPGVGPKKADKILDASDGSPEDMWRAVEAAFVTQGYSADEALTQARVARILRDTDWDQTKQRVKLWTPPRSSTSTVPVYREATELTLA